MVMNRTSNEKIKGTLIVPMGLILMLIPFSWFIGWNLFTGVLFWYVITPALAIYLPEIFIRNKTHWLESLVGLAVFYVVMVFMIYDHYKTDYFKMMMVSLVANVMVVLLVLWTKRHQLLTLHARNIWKK